MPEAPPHWYAVLGVPVGADAEALRRAYRERAARWHPDANGGNADAEARFKVIAQAWEVLGDPERRVVYDAVIAGFGDGRVEAALAAGGFLDRLFGVSDRAPEAGRNRRLRLVVSAAEVIRGDERVVELPDDETCERCGGLGTAADEVPCVCEPCGGRGEVVVRPMMRATWATCPTCAGRGFRPVVGCGACEGRGRTSVTQRLIVPLPAGVRDGQTLRVAGAGEWPLGGPAGGPRGDLWIDVSVAPDARFRVDGEDVVHERAVPVWLALAGGRVDVETAWGKVEVDVPAGSREGDRLLLAGWGVGRRGNQLIHLRIEWPTELTVDERARLRSWGEALPATRFPRSGEGVGTKASDEGGERLS